jgi:hypothetical protein
MNDKLVTIAKYTDAIETGFVKQSSADYRLEAVETGESASNIHSIPAMGGPELQVLENQGERAKALLESQEKQEK